MLNLGRNIQKFDKGDEFEFERIVINYGTDENGATLTVVSPQGSSEDLKTYEMTLNCFPDGNIVQAIADNLLAAQVPHQSATIENAKFDIAYELGDTIMANGNYVTIGAKSVSQDGSPFASIESQDIDEEEDGYIFATPSVRDLQRNYNKVITKLSVETGRIEALVEAEQERAEGEESTLSSQLEIEAGKIGLVVEETQSGNVIKAAKIVEAINDSGSQVIIDADHIDLSGTVTVSQATQIAQDEADDRVGTLEDEMAAGTTVIDGDCIITDTLALNNIRCRGTLLNVKNSNGTTVGYLGEGQGNDGRGSTQGVVLVSPSGNYYVICTDRGVRMQAGNCSMYVSANGCFYNNGGGNVPMGEAVWGS